MAQETFTFVYTVNADDRQFITLDKNGVTLKYNQIVADAGLVLADEPTVTSTINGSGPTPLLPGGEVYVTHGSTAAFTAV